jgi:hypothetical protein
MRSVEELRIEARRLQEAAGKLADPTLKAELAGRAFELAQHAEIIERSMTDVRVLQRSIDRYRSMLATGLDDPAQRQIVHDMLDDLETLLVSKKSRE